MRNIRTAFEEFWQGYLNRSVVPPVPLKAYQDGYAVEYGPKGKSEPELPYITYSLARPSFGDFTIITGRIWTISTSWGLVDDVLSQAAERVPEDGAKLDLGIDGAIMLYRSNPFVQYLPPDERLSAAGSPAADPMMKAGIISLIIKSYVI